MMSVLDLFSYYRDHRNKHLFFITDFNICLPNWHCFMLAILPIGKTKKKSPQFCNGKCRATDLVPQPIITYHTESLHFTHHTSIGIVIWYPLVLGWWFCRHYKLFGRHVSKSRYIQTKSPWTA